MDCSSSAGATTAFPPTTTATITTTPADSATPAPSSSAPHAPLSPPASPTLSLRDARVSHYTKPLTPPRFPRHPCPTSHYTLSLLSSEHEAQRLFGASFTLRSPTTGELLGPFALLSYTDAWIPKYCRYIHSVLSTGVFTLRERELIVLAVAGVTEAEYISSVHSGVARAVGLSGETVEGVLSGEAWTVFLDLSLRERRVYRLAREMAGAWGRVSEETWSEVVVKDRAPARGEEGWLEKEVEDLEGMGGPENMKMDGGAKGEKTGHNSHEDDESEKLTREEVATLAQVLASTMFVSVLVNCADIEAPRCDADIVQQP